MQYLKTDHTIDSYKLLMTKNFTHNSTQPTNRLTDLMDSQQPVMFLLSYSTAFSLCLTGLLFKSYSNLGLVSPQRIFVDNSRRHLRVGRPTSPSHLCACYLRKMATCSQARQRPCAVELCAHIEGDK